MERPALVQQEAVKKLDLLSANLQLRQQFIAQGMNFVQTGELFGFQILGLRGEDLRGQRMELAMNGIEGLKSGERNTSSQTLSVQPHAQPATIRIQTGRGRTLASEEGLQSRDPGAMFNRGVE